MHKKTLKVKELIDKINSYLGSDNISQCEKSGFCTLLETILHDTGNYRGFSYNFNWTTASDQEKLDKEYNRCYYTSYKLQDDIKVTRMGNLIIIDKEAK